MEKFLQLAGILFAGAIIVSLFRALDAGEIDFDSSNSQYYSRQQIIELMQNQDLLCSNFDGRNSCENVIYPITVGGDYYTYQVLLIIAVPQANNFIKIQILGRSSVKRNSACETPRISDLDDASFFYSQNDLAHISDTDIRIPENEGASELHDLIKRNAASEIDGVEECVFFEPHETNGSSVSSLRVITAKYGQELKEKEFILHMFSGEKARKVRLRAM